MSTVVVSDSSPLHYLVLCEAAHVLPHLFERVIIPTAVLHELQHPHTPELVRQWMSALPPWAEVRPASEAMLDVKLGLGETEAINLALKIQAAAVLIDDGKARKAASRHGLVVLGTLPILEEAAARHLIDLPQTIVALQRTNFHVTPHLIAATLDRYSRRVGEQERSSETPPRRPGIKP